MDGLAPTTKASGRWRAIAGKRVSKSSRPRVAWSCSQRGTEVAALFYSMIESAKLFGVDPKAYLLQAARAALAAPGTVTLPHTLRG